MQVAAHQQSEVSTVRLGWRSWALGSVALVLWMAFVASIAYQFRAGWNIVAGEYYDTPYLRAGFSEREAIQGTQQPFRWTTGEAQIVQPLVGNGTWAVRLNLLTSHPDGSPVNATLNFPDGTSLKIPDSFEPRTIHAFVPPQTSGNLDLRLRSNIYKEPAESARELGIAVFGIQSSPVGTRPWLAPWLGIALLALIALGAAWTLKTAGLAWPLAVGIAAAVGTGITIPLTQVRLPYAFWLPGLALLIWIGLGLTTLLRWMVPILFRRGGVELEERTLTILLLLFVGSFWIKGGGQLYPYMIAIDVHWHMDRVRWILDGRLEEMYKPGAFNESVMPEKEWGSNRPTIPYSPFFHIFATIFAIFPWKLETTAKIFSTTIDSTRVFLIFYLARAFGISRRGAILGATTYLIFPATYLLHSWGNVPTTFGMWWTLIVSAFMIGTWGKQEQRRPWLVLAILPLAIGISLLGMWWALLGGATLVGLWWWLERGKPWMILTLLLLVTFLIYTVMAVYLGMLLIVWLSWIAVRRRSERGQVAAIAWAIIAALGLSLAIYYGQYVPEIIAKTLPYFGQTLTQGQESVGAVPFQETYSDYLLFYIPRLWFYGLLIPFILMPLVFGLLRNSSLVDRQAPKAWLGPIWMASMIAIGLIFVPIARSVPMVDKNVFFLMPVCAIGMGLIIDALLAWIDTRFNQPRWSFVLSRAMVGVYLAVTFVAAINLWLYRIDFVKQ